MSEGLVCWSCKNTITNTDAMLTDGPFEDGLMHEYCSIACWMGGK